MYIVVHFYLFIPCYNVSFFVNDECTDNLKLDKAILHLVRKKYLSKFHELLEIKMFMQSQLDSLSL